MTGVRIVCLQCRTQREATEPSCATCGSGAFAYARATRGDLTAGEQQVLNAAELVSDVLTREVHVTRSHPSAMQLAAACRALAFARAGYVGA